MGKSETDENGWGLWKAKDCWGVNPGTLPKTGAAYWMITTSKNAFECKIKLKIINTLGIWTYIGCGVKTQQIKISRGNCPRSEGKTLSKIMDCERQIHNHMYF